MRIGEILLIEEPQTYAIKLLFPNEYGRRYYRNVEVFTANSQEDAERIAEKWVSEHLPHGSMHIGQHLPYHIGPYVKGAEDDDTKEDLEAQYAELKSQIGEKEFNYHNPKYLKLKNIDERLSTLKTINYIKKGGYKEKPTWMSPPDNIISRAIKNQQK